MGCQENCQGYNASTDRLRVSQFANCGDIDKMHASVCLWIHLSVDVSAYASIDRSTNLFLYESVHSD